LFFLASPIFTFSLILSIGWHSKKPVEHELSPEHEWHHGCLWDLDKKRHPLQVQPWDYDQHCEQDHQKAYDQHYNDGQHSDNNWQSEKGGFPMMVGTKSTKSIL